MEKSLIPMAGDHVTFLDCSSCYSLTDCVMKARTNKLPEVNRHHIQKGIVNKSTGSNFGVQSRPGLYRNGSIIQIRRDIIAEAKAQEAPDNIIPLDF